MCERLKFSRLNMSDNEKDGPPKFAVICFLPRRGQGQDEIDLVPYSWLDLKNDKLFCYYPNTKKDLKKRDKYLERLCVPKSSWVPCEIEVISTTSTLEQGRRHLKRAEVTLLVDTDTAGNPLVSESIVQEPLNEDNINEELQAIQSMSSVVFTPQSEDYTHSGHSRDHGFNHSLSDLRSGSSISSLANDNPFKIVVSEKSSKDKTEKAEQLDSTNKELFALMKGYMDCKFDEIFKKINDLKLSIEYDMKKQSRNMKTQIMMRNNSINTPHTSLSTAMEEYNGLFPISKLEDFQTFETKLEDPNEKKKLKDLIRVIVYGETEAVVCIRKSLGEIFTPPVQLQYSGAGRVVRGSSKLNFSVTNTYSCLKDVLEEKFGDSDQIKNFRTKVGTFLANAGDRDGGRHKRVEAKSN